MGCRPSKQATSKVRAIEHKEDPRCLCSPRKVRKNHKCSDGSSTSSKRVSGGIKSSSKKHSFSSGHKPRAAKSADMDFPAFSTTTAVYRKSASKTSKITLRLSCDGSTLEIEQCDYDLERAYGETAPKPRPWSSAPNLSRLRDGKARLFRDSYLPMKHSKSAWSPSVTSTASGSRDCKVRVPVFINTTDERMSSKSLANTNSHRSSNASQTGSCSSRQKGSTGKTALPRTCSKKDGFMSLTDANRSLTFHEGQCSPGNQATDGSRASVIECGVRMKKTRTYGNSTDARSGSMHMTASCTLENMMNNLECSLKMSHHPAHSSCWDEGNQPNVSCSLVPNQPNFSIDEIAPHELRAASSARYVIETSSDDSFHSENSSEFEQIPVNVISSFIAPASSNTTCCETDSNHNPIGVSSDVHYLSDSHEARWSREGDARECLILAHQTNPNHDSCLKNGLRDFQFEKLRCAHAKSTNFFKNSLEANPYSRSEEPVSYEPSHLWAKAHRTDGADSYPHQNSPYLATPIDTNSILTFVTLGCPVSNEMPNFLCTPEDEATLSLFTPQRNMIYPYDGVCNPCDGVCIHYDSVPKNSVEDQQAHSSPRNTSMDTDDDMRSVQCHLCRSHRAADDDVPFDNLTHFRIGDSEASILNHGHVPVSSHGHGKDVTSSRTIDLGPVVEAPFTELPGGKRIKEGCHGGDEIPPTDTSLVSSVSCVEHETNAEFICPGFNAFGSTEATQCLQNQGGNFTFPSEASNSNETSESSSSASSNSDETISTIERQNRESPRRSEHFSSKHCSMFSRAPESDSAFSTEYVYCNTNVNVEDGSTDDRLLTDAECLIIGTLWGSAGQINCSTTGEYSDHRCVVGEIKEAKTSYRFDANSHPWADEYGGRYDKQSNSNHSSSSAETIQIIHCESMTPHDGYQHDTDRDGSNEKADYLVELLKDDSSQKLAISHVETRFSYDFDYSREREIDTISVSDASDYEISPLVYKYLGGKEPSSTVTRSVQCGASHEKDPSSALTSMQSVRLDILLGHLARLDPKISSQRDLHESHSVPRLTDDNYVSVACLSPVSEESFSEDEHCRGIKGIGHDNLLLPCTGLSNAIASDEITNRENLVSLVLNELHWIRHGHEKAGDKQLRGTDLQLRGDILAKNINDTASHLQVPPGNPLEGHSTSSMEIKKKRTENPLHTPSTCCISGTTLSPCILTSSNASLTENPWGPPAPTPTVEREQLHFKESRRSISVLISGLGRPHRNSEHLQNRGGIDPRQETHLNPDTIPDAPVTPLRRLNGGEDMSGRACISKCSSNNCAYTDRRKDCMRANTDTSPDDCTATARNQSSANDVLSRLIESVRAAPGTVRSENISRGAFSCPNSGLADDGLVRRDESAQPKITSDSSLLSGHRRFFGKMCSDRCEASEPLYTSQTSQDSIDAQLHTSPTSQESIDTQLHTSHTSQESIDAQLHTSHTSQDSIDTQLHTSHTSQESIDTQLHTSHTSQESIDAQLHTSHTSQDSIDEQLHTSHTSQESIDAQLHTSHTSQESIDAQLHTSYTSQESIDALTSMRYLNIAAVSCTCPSDHTSASVVEQPSKIENIDQVTVVTLDLYPGISRDLKSCHECDFTQGAELETLNDTRNERGTAPVARDDPTSDTTAHQLTAIGKIHRSNSEDQDIRVNEPAAFKAETSTHTSTDDTRQALGQHSQFELVNALEGISLAYRPNLNNNNTPPSSHLLLYSSQPSSTLALQHGIDPSGRGPPCCPVSAHSSRRPSKDPCASLPSNSPTPSSSPTGNGSAGTSSLNNSRLFIDRAGVDSVNKPTAPNQESQQQNEETERVPRKNVLSLVRYFEKVPFAHRETK